MDRYVIVESIQGDKARLERRIADAGFRLIDPIGQDQGVALVSHPEFARCDGPMALSMVCDLKEWLAIASQYAGRPVGKFEFRRVLRVDSDGTQMQEAFAECVGQSGVLDQSSFTVNRSDETEEQRLLREAEEERLRREAEGQEDARVGRLIKALAAQEVVREILEVVNDPRATSHALWAMYEKVKEAVRGPNEVAKLINCGRDEVDRFWGTINNDVESLGADARHGASRRKKPANPMTLEEAREFARRIGHAWIDRLAA